MMECVLALALAMSMGVSLGMLYHATQAMKLMHDAVSEHRQMVRRIVYLEAELRRLQEDEETTSELEQEKSHEQHRVSGVAGLAQGGR